MNELRIELFQLATTGRMKHLRISTDGEYLVTQWWTSWDGNNGLKQVTRELMQPMNEGRSNATTAVEQCQLEFARKRKKKTDQGYSPSYSDAAQAPAGINISERLPTSFVPSKPVNSLPKTADPFDGTWLAERKRKGNCVVIQRREQELIVYSRGMKVIGPVVTVVDVVRAAMLKIPPDSMYIGELIATSPDGVEDEGILRGVMSEKTTRDKAQQKYDQSITDGYKWEFYCFDVLFHCGEDVTMHPFTDRRKLTEAIFGPRLVELFTEEIEQAAIDLHWEGFVLRQPDSTIEYSLDGKPRRRGGYKRKFEYETDVVVTGATKGVGKYAEVFASFRIAQLLPDGMLLDCGNCGPGKLSAETLVELTQELADRGYAGADETFADEDRFVFELKYQDRHKLNAKGQRCFEIPHPKRVRDDKPVHECIYE